MKCLDFFLCYHQWRTKSPVEHLRWNFFFSEIAYYFCKKATSNMFDWLVNMPPTPAKNYNDLLSTKYFLLLHQTVKV